jgi:pimeloyl-ACP methyl ester carboxylesterase
MKSNTTELHQEIIDYKGEKITYFTNFSSNDGRETLVLLHPAFADHTIFEKQIEYFNDYQIIAIDMIGHGENNNLSNNLTIADVPIIVNEIVKNYKIDVIHVIGVSLGSLVAQAVAYQYPAIIKSVTVVGGYSIHKDNQDIMKAQGKEMGKWLLKIIFSMKSFRKYVTNVSTDSREGKRLFRQGADKFKRKSFIAMQGMSKLMIDVEEEMTYPMLIVVGENDLELAVNASKRLHEIEPRSQLAIIEGSGHCANIDSFKLFNDVLRKYLNTIK